MRPLRVGRPLRGRPPGFLLRQSLRNGEERQRTRTGAGCVAGALVAARVPGAPCGVAPNRSAWGTLSLRMRPQRVGRPLRGRPPMQVLLLLLLRACLRWVGRPLRGRPPGCLRMLSQLGHPT
eukprot:gene20832-biopygen19143